MYIQNKIELDMRLFLIEAVATNPRAVKQLNTVYKKHCFRAYAYARKSDLYNHPMIMDGDIYKEVASKRMLGLVLYGEIDKDINDEILKIIEKGWTKLYNYIKKKNKIFIEEISSIFFNENQTEDEINGIMAITLILAEMFDIIIVENKRFEFVIITFYNRLKHYNEQKNNNDLLRLSYDNITPELHVKAKSIINRCFTEYGTINTLQDIFGIRDESIKILIDSFSFIYDTEDLMFLSVTNNPKVDIKDLEELAVIYYVNYRNQNKFEAMKFILASMFIKYTAKAYKEVKKYHFQNNQESIFYEMEQLENDNEKLKNDNKLLQEVNNKIAIENKKLKQEYKSTLEREIIKQKKENAKLQKQIKQLNKQRELDNNELEKLRDLLFENVEVEDQQQDNIDNINLENIKVVIFGGTPTWVNKTKELLPISFKFVDGISDFNANILKNIDIILFKYTDMKHSIYYKAVNVAKKYDIPFNYIKTNSIDEIKRKINNTIL